MKIRSRADRLGAAGGLQFQAAVVRGAHKKGGGQSNRANPSANFPGEQKSSPQSTLAQRGSTTRGVDLKFKLPAGGRLHSLVVKRRNFIGERRVPGQQDLSVKFCRNPSASRARHFLGRHWVAELPLHRLGECGCITGWH